MDIIERNTPIAQLAFMKPFQNRFKMIKALFRKKTLYV